MLPFNFTVDILGIYPTLETLLPQFLLLLATAVTFVLQLRKGKRIGKVAMRKGEGSNEE
jgi:high-affinity iron transporter